jgi:hypothetical protein
MCGRCNRPHNSDPFPYMNYMHEHYGAEVVTELHELRMSLEKVTDEELRVLLSEYKSVV